MMTMFLKLVQPIQFAGSYEFLHWMAIESQQAKLGGKSLSAMGYEDRSKALQMAIRNFIAEYAWKAERGKLGAGAVLVTYDQETHGIQEELTHAQHRYRDVISSTMHIHLDESRCLEIISVRGKLERIQTLAKELMKTKGVSQLKLSTISL